MNISTKILDIIIECGADFTMNSIVRDDTDALIDLTGATVTAHLREYAEASDYFAFTATHNGAGGKVTLSMNHENTAQIGYSRGVYDVFIVFPDETTEKYLMGDVTVIPAVTKPVAGTVMYLLSFESEEDFPLVGLVDRLYFSHASGKPYRWNGTNYVGISMDGEAATIEVGTVTTLPAGSPATVENVGSMNNAKFNFGIPKGDPGVTNWDDIQNVPETFPPEAHDHDDRYYTETEVNDALALKSSVVHTHGNISTSGAVSSSVAVASGDRLLIADSSNSNKVARISPSFDGSTTNQALTKKGTFEEFSTPSHNHDGVYSPIDHNHDAEYSAIDHNHDTEYSAIDHTHNYEDLNNLPTLGALAEKDTADWEYDIDNIPETFPPSTHNHDDRYYTESEMDGYLQNKADIIHSTASGSIVSITDGAPLPVDSLVVAVEPVQDLHGYSNPWPAGGGKNLWGNGNISVTGYALIEFVKSLDAGTYTISAVVSSTDTDTNTCSISFRDSSNAVIGTAGIGRSSGTTRVSVNVTLTGTAVKAYFYAANGSSASSGDTATFNDIQIESGSSATAYAPYENICPISGHTSAVVTRTGVNIWDEEWEAGSIDNSTGQNINLGTDRIRSKNYIPVKPNTSYCFVAMNTSIAQFLYFYDTNKGFLSIDGNVTRPSYVFTTPANCYYIRFRTGNNYGTTYNHDISINHPSTDTQYHAYQGQTVTIDLDGTRYGGTVNVLTGEMTVDRAIITLNGSQSTSLSPTWLPSETSIAFGYAYSLTNNAFVGSTKTDPRLLCDCLPTETYDNIYAKSVDVGVAMYQNDSYGLILRLNHPELNTKALLNAWLEDNPITVVYPLATPLTLTLTAQQMSTLLGQNAVWASTGDVALGYRADTKFYIDGQLSALKAELQALILENS